MAFSRLKTILSSQLLRVAGPGGNRLTSGPLIGSNYSTPGPNQGIDPLADNQGRLYIVPSDGFGAIGGTPGTTQLPVYSSGGYKELDEIYFDPFPNSFQLLTLIWGFNINAAVRFLQIYDVPGLAAPPPGTPAYISILVPPSTNFSLSMGNGLLTQSPGGVIWASSTAGDIYTPSGTPDFFVNAMTRHNLKSDTSI